MHPGPNAQPSAAPVTSSFKPTPAKQVSVSNVGSPSTARPAPGSTSKFQSVISTKPSKPKPKPALSVTPQKGVNGTVSNAASSSSSAAGRSQPLSLNIFKSPMTHVSKGTPSKPPVPKHLTQNSVNGTRPSTASTSSPAIPNVPSSSSVPLTGMKRPVTSSTADEPNPSKKAKSSSSKEGCAVCGRDFHLLKDCPIVVAGPKRYVLIEKHVCPMIDRVVS